MGRQGTLLSARKVDYTIILTHYQKAKAMADMPDEDYHKFLCVEVGIVIDDVQLPAGQSWEATHTIKAL